jgi:hypothetical protein
MKLARKVTGDLAPRILLDELVRSGAAELREGEVAILKGEAYVPKIEAGEQMQILAEDPTELVETILRNTLGEGEERLPTVNPAIWATRPTRLPDDFTLRLERLYDAAANGEDQLIRSMLEDLMPDYAPVHASAQELASASMTAYADDF